MLIFVVRLKNLLLFLNLKHILSYFILRTAITQTLFLTISSLKNGGLTEFFERAKAQIVTVDSIADSFLIDVEVNMQNSISSFGHSALKKGHLLIGVLMLSSFLASPTWAGNQCNEWCTQKGYWWCNFGNQVKNRLCGLFGTTSERGHGYSMGTIRIPLMATNNTILLPGKKVVVFTWEGGQAPYSVIVKKNGQTCWKTEINDPIVKVKKNDCRFEAGRYWLIVSSSVKDARTGKYIKTSRKRKLTVKKTGCSPNYSQQELISFDTIPSQCKFEAFQQLQ